MNATSVSQDGLTPTGPGGAPPQPSGGRSPVPLAWALPQRRWVTIAIMVGGVLLLGAAVQLLMRGPSIDVQQLVFYTVRRADLPIVVTERGNLASQQTEEILCEVESFGGDRSGNTGTQILFVVPNGSSVKKGELLVELDSAPLKERLDSQFLAMQRSEAEMIQAQSKYENQITQNETDLAEAVLDKKLAEIDLQSYENEDGQGTYQIELQNLEMEVQKARAAQLISRSDFSAIETLYRLGYRSKGELESAKLKLLEADSLLASQIAARRQLQRYTYTMRKKNLRGKSETAVRNVEQVRQSNKAALAQALATKESAERAYAKEKDRYDRYTEQLAKCKIIAPQDGMVAYAAPEGRSSSSTVIQEGAFVRKRQKILTLPNLKQMQVNTAIHESVLDQVKVGLPAQIRVDAFSERSYRGSVKSVAVLPDPGSWFSSDIKVYKTIVTIDEDVSQLKPGMTAVVEIFVERLKNVVSVPVQAVVQRRSKNWCYVRQGGDVARRAVEVGKTNDKFVQIVKGVQAGEQVVLNPDALTQDEEESQPDGRRKQRRPTKQRAADDTAAKSQGSGRGRGRADTSSRENGGTTSSAANAIDRFDRDGDGKLSRDELPDQMQAAFDTFDANDDGVIDAAELKSQQASQRPNKRGG